MYTFGQRNLVVTDVEIGKLITIKDADYFVDRSVNSITTEKRGVLNGLNYQGSIWCSVHRTQR